MNWFYVDAKNEQVGPYDEDDMAALISGSKVAPDTLVWKEGYPDWVPARSVQEFSMLFEDYGEQATMIGGVTFSQGAFTTDVQAPAYAAASQKQETKSGASTGSRPTGSSHSVWANALAWIRSLFKGR
jgi:hypothetical protein